jgi:Derlin-2/3
VAPYIFISKQFYHRFGTYDAGMLILMQGLNYFFTGAVIFTSALILALSYTACQDDRLGKATLIVVTVPATWIPLAMLFLTFVIVGPHEAKVQSTGLIAAHLHDFLTNLYPTFGGGRNWLRTPGFIEHFFADPLPKVINRSYGTAIRPGQQSQGLSTGASTSGVLPESWRSRGSGHRLGGD